MRVVFVSDTHDMPDTLEAEALFPNQLKRLPLEEASAVYQKVRHEVAAAYQASLAWIGQQPRFDLMIHLGDITGGWLECGIYHSVTRALAQEVRRDMDPLAKQKRLCAGNHDTGYWHPKVPGSTIRVDSVEACAEIFGDLFWAHEQDGLLLLGICSPIAEYRGTDPRLCDLRAQQEAFIAKTLAAHLGPWVLCAHSPWTPLYLASVLTPHVDRMLKMVCGDIHSVSSGNLVQRLARWLPPIPWRRWQVLRECLRKLALCPATAPLWWPGYGLLTLTWDNGQLTTEQVILPRPESVHTLPTSSFRRCLWWMLKPKPF